MPADDHGAGGRYAILCRLTSAAIDRGRELGDEDLEATDLGDFLGEAFQHMTPGQFRSYWRRPRVARLLAQYPGYAAAVHGPRGASGELLDLCEELLGYLEDVAAAGLRTRRRISAIAARVADLRLADDTGCDPDAVET